MSIELESQVVLLKLLVGLYSQNEVTSWADKHILELEVTPVELFDLSLSKAPHEQISILKKLSNSKLEFRAFIEINIDLRDRFRSGKIDFFEVADKLVKLKRHIKNLPEYFVEFCVWVEYEADLLEKGYKDIKTSEKDLNEYFDELGSV